MLAGAGSTADTNRACGDTTPPDTGATLPTNAAGAPAAAPTAGTAANPANPGQPSYTRNHSSGQRPQQRPPQKGNNTKQIPNNPLDNYVYNARNGIQ
ncbi:Uncharacterised protein [Mycobacterium tuberculosis]|nr:Uncharacterised protein [Mycobacterium tuberculosis]